MKIADVMVIDFEASGLACDSWPIEIGLAWLGPSGGPDPKVEFWSSMIRPESDWCESLWDPISEEIHGISLEEVKAEGRSAWDVAVEVRARIEGKILGPSVVAARSASSFCPNWRVIECSLL